MNQSESKLNLVYIAGVGHSGSTLLEMMLGAHSSIAASGEIEMWPHKILNGGKEQCGCGNLIHECPFWVEVGHREDPLRQPNPQIHFFRQRNGGGKTLRWRHLRDFIARASASELNDEARIYGENNKAIFEAFLSVEQERTGKTSCWIVDNSKNPYRLLWLLKSNAFNIKVLHIVKDPRALAYSAIKHLIPAGNGSAPKLQLLLVVFRKSLSWIIQNWLIVQESKSYLPASSYALVQYEKLASSPENTMKKICKMVGVDYETEMIWDFYGNHAIAGNHGARFQKKGIILDEKWRLLLPNSYRRLAELVTWISRSTYGY